MVLWLIILLIIIAIIVLDFWLFVSDEETLRKNYEELDKILPLSEEIKGKIYPTSVETYINYVVARGRITNSSKREGWIEENYRCEHYIKFQDGKSLSLRGNHVNTFLEGGINRIVFYKSDNRIHAITYR